MRGIRVVMAVVFVVGLMGIPVTPVSAEGSWADSLKLKGDLRLRNEYKDVENPAGTPDAANNRTRIRFRLGGKAEINDQVKIGFGIASGSTDGATSTNQTLEGNFNQKDLWIDYMYADYQPNDWLQLIGGKFKTIFMHTDMLWDSDIRFDGFAGKVKSGEVVSGLKLFASGGYFPIKDTINSRLRDIFLMVGQGGLVYTCPEGCGTAELGVGYYAFENVKGFHAGKGNTVDILTTLAHDYRVTVPSLKMSCNSFFGIDALPWGVLGEIANNNGPSKDNDAWRAGLWLGDDWVKEAKDWKVLVQRSWIEKDAFIGTFPDADFGGTGRKGWEAIVYIGLTKGVVFSVDYYDTSVIGGNNMTQNDEQLTQVDFIFKF